MESALNICVTYDHSRFGQFVLGRTSIEETGLYSVCCAIQNLWLAARAEGIGVGWPENIKLVGYLCLGYVEEFADKPDLEKAGWLPRLKLDKVVYYDQWNSEVKDT